MRRLRSAWSRFHIDHFRHGVSLTLVLAATLLLLPAIITNWARTQIYDEDNFASNAVAALENDTVRSAVATAIVDEIIRVGPAETLSVRPLLDFVTSTVVETQAFEEIYRDAVADMHRDLFERGPGRGAVALTLVDAIIVVTAFVEQAYPEVADQIPANLSMAFVEIRERDWAVQVVTLGEDVEILAFILPALSIALYALAVWVSPHRRQTIVVIGLSCVTVGALLVLGRDYARDIVLDQVGFADRAVSEAIWDVYTRSLLGWATLAGGTGVLIAVGATGAHQRVDPRQQFDTVRRAIVYTPPSQWGKVVRASAFIAVGFFAITQRDQLFELATLFAASYVIYYGLTELIWLAGPGTARARERAPEPARRRWVTPGLALRGVSVAALVVAGLTGAFVTYQAIETAGGPALAQPAVKACNGHEALCDRRLDEVVFFGTHNSMAAAAEPGWFLAEHRTGILAQLDSGVRALMIDTWYGYDTGRGIRSADRDFVASGLSSEEYNEAVIAAARRLAGLIGDVQPGQPRGTYLCHNYCELGATYLTHALRQIDGFLERHPNEVLILLIQDQITPEDTAKAFIASGLLKRVYHHVEGEPFPTLREMIERGERVVVFAESNASGIDWYLQAWDFIQDTHFRVEAPGQFPCSLDRGQAGHPLFLLNHWVSAPFPSQATARFVNGFDFLYERVQRCESERGRQVNIIAVNFYELGDTGLVVDVLNGVAEPPVPPEATETPGPTAGR